MSNEDLVYRLRKRAEIRRNISTRKSVQEGKPDRIANLMEEAADRIEDLERNNENTIQDDNTTILKPIFKVPVKVCLDYEQKQIALRYLNEVHLGDTQCNIYSRKAGRLVSKYPEKETDAFKESHYRVQATKVFCLELELQTDGTLKLLQVSV